MYTHNSHSYIKNPIRNVLGQNGNFVQAKAYRLDPETKTLVCKSTHDKEEFAIKYDKLVISVGVKTNTFGIDTMTEGDGIYFLKHLFHARNIRNNIIDCFEKAAIPGTSVKERERLLSFVVVGGVSYLYTFILFWLFISIIRLRWTCLIQSFVFLS